MMDDVVNDLRVRVPMATGRDGSLKFVDCGYLNFVNTFSATRPAAA